MNGWISRKTRIIDNFLFTFKKISIPVLYLFWREHAVQDRYVSGYENSDRFHCEIFAKYSFVPDIDGTGRKIYPTLYSRSVSETDKKRAQLELVLVTEFFHVGARCARGICRLSIAPDRCRQTPTDINPRVSSFFRSRLVSFHRETACYRSSLPAAICLSRRKNCGCTELYNYEVFKYTLQRDFTNVFVTNRASWKKDGNPFVLNLARRNENVWQWDEFNCG